MSLAFGHGARKSRRRIGGLMVAPGLVLMLAACSSEIPGPNRAPVAVAGLDQSVRLPQSVRLDGRGSYDPDGDSITAYDWQLLVAPTDAQAQIIDAKKAVASLTPDRPGIWTVRLVVHDGQLDSPPAVVRVTVAGGYCEQDGDCLGATQCSPETCEQGLCKAHPVPDGSECGQRYCDDLLFMRQTCMAGVCAGAQIEADCDDGDSCSADSCAALDGCHSSAKPVGSSCGTCQACDADGQCRDDLHRHTDCPVCMECAAAGSCVPQADGDDHKDDCQAGDCLGERCDGTGKCEILPAGAACDDLVFCNGADTCDPQGLCSLHTGDPCPAGECARCQEETDTCFEPAGSACTDDGFDCTAADQCDGAGACAGTPDDSLCALNALCRPACSPDASGCVKPPDSLTLLCDPLVALPATAACTLTLTGASAEGQAPCLTCSASLGATIIEDTDFGDSAGQCGLGAWSLAPGASEGNNCLDDIKECQEGGKAKDCCDDVGKICSQDLGGFSLHQDKATGCGNQKEEWRLSQTFDFTGLTDLRACLDVAQQGADLNDGVLIYLDDGQNRQQVFCFLGGAGAGPDSFFSRVCSRVFPDWAEDNPALTVEIVVHSETENHKVYLDNVALVGWGGACEPVVETVLAEDFVRPSACEPDEWQDIWTIDPISAADCNSFDCLSHPDWSPGIEADGASFNLSTTVDAGPLDENITVCFQLGYDGTASPDTVSLGIDIGAGWKEVWSLMGTMGWDEQCREYCVNLSDHDPAVNNHPALKIGFGLVSVQGVIDLYQVTVSGGRRCAAGSDTIAIESGSAGMSPGQYPLKVTNLSGGSLTAHVECVWESEAALQDTAPVTFLKP